MSWKVKKRGKYYHYEVRYGPQLVRRSARTTNKAIAEDVARKVEEDLIRQVELGTQEHRTWADAIVEWRKENEHKKSLETDIYRLRVLIQYLLPQTRLGEINKQFLHEIITELREDRDLSNASVNRYQSLISVVLKHVCHELEWIQSVPHLSKKKEPKGRYIYTDAIGARRLISKAAEWHRRPLAFGFATGLRKTNLYSLKWNQVDLAKKVAWFYGDETKSGKELAIPISDSAIEMLRSQIGQHHEYVWGGINPPRNEVFNKWVRKAGLPEGFTIHSIRHSWATWHTQRGTTLHELMELGGWHSIDMVLRYAHHSTSSLSHAAKRIESDTHTTQKGIAKVESFLEAV